MRAFAIQRAATTLCRWESDDGPPIFHARAVEQGGLLVVEESLKVAFAVLEPAEDFEYRLKIGDVPLGEIADTAANAAGFALGDRIVWAEQSYFESARGRTRILVERQPSESTPEQWEAVRIVEVYVLPSKLGESRYDAMTDELQRISRSLLTDLYGKSRHTHDLLVAKEGSSIRSGEEELQSIETVLDRLDPLLRSIGRRPASRIGSTPEVGNYWGGERLSPGAMAWLARRGTGPNQPERPIPIFTRRKSESFDIPEHRVVRAFLQILIRRSRRCGRAAQSHVAAIQSERPFRDIHGGKPASIFESVDLPKMKRLERAEARAAHARRLAAALNDLPYLRDVPPELVAVRQGAFQRNAEYRLLLFTIRQFLLSHAIWYDGSDQSDVTKLTSRLFEQWCYLRIVEGFRSAGLVLQEWDDALRQSVRSRFILDFDRGLAFHGELGTDFRLRFRYEPWILSRESAVRTGETLCRGLRGDVAWSPDVVIECLQRQAGGWRPVYCVVLDCKYTTAIRPQHWTDTQKYLEIRDAQTQRQVVKQLWLIAPAAASGLACEDSSIDFTADGPTCQPDEAVRFSLTATPGAEESGDAFRMFATGTVAYLRRHFGGR